MAVVKSLETWGCVDDYYHQFDVRCYMSLISEQLLEWLCHCNVVRDLVVWLFCLVLRVLCFQSRDSAAEADWWVEHGEGCANGS